MKLMIKYRVKKDGSHHGSYFFALSDQKAVFLKKQFLVPVVENKLFKIAEKFEIKVYGDNKKATVFTP